MRHKKESDMELVENTPVVALFCNIYVVVRGKMKKKAPSSAMVTVELLYCKLCNASHARPALVPT